MCMKSNPFILLFLNIVLMTSCSKKEEESSTVKGASKIYVTTGSCNSGVGITTYTTTATRTLEEYNIETASHVATLLDYNSPGTFVTATHPRSVVDNGSSLFVLNENATTTAERKVILVPKSSPLSFASHYANPTVLNGAVTRLFKDDDGSLLISKSTAIEKINAIPVRLPAGTNPWVSTPGGDCATSTTSISAVLALPKYSGASAGKVVYLHQGASAALNRIGMISHSGYFSASDCLSGVEISSVTHTKAENLTQETVSFHPNGTSPTSMVFIPFANGTKIGKILVSYSNGQTSNNLTGTYTLNHGLVMWDVDETGADAATLSNPVVVFDDNTIVFGVSAMAYDPLTGYLYVATAGEPGVVNQTTNAYGYNIEKFSVAIDSNGSPTVTRVSNAGKPFIKGGAHTKCISGLSLGD